MIAAHPAPPGDRSRYEGAAVLDATGRVIGELEAFSQSSEVPTAVLRIGGWSDFMGVFDAGGRIQQVPEAALIFGPLRSIGATYVVVLPRSDGASVSG